MRKKSAVFITTSLLLLTIFAYPSSGQEDMLLPGSLIPKVKTLFDKIWPGMTERAVFSEAKKLGVPIMVQVEGKELFFETWDRDPFFDDMEKRVHATLYISLEGGVVKCSRYKFITDLDFPEQRRGSC